MSAQHTQGPWRVDDSESDRVCVRSEDGGLIADCTDGFYDDSGDWRMAAESAPNARLIATLPELLSVLQRALPHIEREAAKAPTEHARMQRQRQAMKDLDAARAVIAKALGAQA